ncbi:DUF397 domain-containing protein [Nocardiopsis baichengensis]|uniref:DUF397 domain-containing protein n=1 Tax=Nocardiopsis baichengensis TaxID=280240 RepID=UPI000347C8E5|nr:DUF397 domain-containing protein [Nocardiopsis baichengensis]
MYPTTDGARWRTSSYTQQQNCVEVADLPQASAVRDSKHRERGHLMFTVAEWRAFLLGIKQDRL